jgi:peptidoglycan/xylan/chitin deacetylase (PgdA/CDA1 family)
VEIELVNRGSGGGSSTVSFGGLTLIPAQNEGKLVFVFDGGSQSILPAASYLHQNGMQADVAVIGKYADYPTEDYLNVSQLKELQDSWGWDMANYTQQYLDAVQQYYNQHDLTAYAADILQQAAWLEANGLNSAPNWFIYPRGSTNAQLEQVVARYYKFARVTADSPDAYPYGDPHEITDLQVQNPGDGEGKHVSDTPPSEILSAVHQAVTHHLTLILTFDRIYSEPNDQPGYPLALLKNVVDGVRHSGIKVMTLSQLDTSNGVSLNNRIYTSAGHPSQITVRISG